MPPRAARHRAVGVRLNDNFEDRGLIEAWDGHRWTISDSPQPRSARDILFGASALSTSDVWAVGVQQGSSCKFETLVEHWNGTRWSVIPSPNPGSTGNHLYGVKAIGPDDVWAVGQQLGASSPDEALIEHWDGSGWSVVPSPTHGSASAMLFSVVGSARGVWAVGETDDAIQGSRPLVERFKNGAWTTVDLPQAGSIFTSLWGVSASDDTVWAVGTFQDVASGDNKTLILRGDEDRFRVVDGPNPGSGDNILGGIATTGDSLWAVGVYKNGGGRQTLIERHQEGLTSEITDLAGGR